MTTLTLQQQFRLFLRNLGYAENTIAGYVSGLNIVSKHYGKDIYQIDDLKEIEQIHRDYASRDGELKNIGGSNTTNLRGGITQWLRFRTQPQQTPTPHMSKETTEYAMSKLPLNQILFGPPGTGKTYETIRAALEILVPEAVIEYDRVLGESKSLQQRNDARENLKTRFDEECNNHRIKFVTFHQSFSYEDFVEGLRAKTDNASGQIRYEVVDGVFKQLCDLASVQVTAINEAPVSLAGRTVWKMSLGSPARSDAGIYDECIEQNCIRLGYGDVIDFTGCKTRADIQNRFEAASFVLSSTRDYSLTSVTAFVTKMKPGDIVVVSEGNSKFRAIGEITGDYFFSPHPSNDDGYAQTRPVKWLRLYAPSLPSNELLEGDFTQQTLYELSPPKLDKDKLTALLRPADAEQQAGISNGARVLIIDEINRGNISRIFGELITLIEPSKRGGASEQLAVTLPYSKTSFKVPDNVYLIGTMNTADRSLAGLDLALRRRFSFKEMPPKPELLDKVSVGDVNIGSLLRIINQRITVLLDRDHCIGHAYFMPLEQTPELALLSEIFQQKIIPLLQEYFFEDWERIRWVLNDQNKSNTTYQFIVRDESLNLGKLFGQDIKVADRPVWRLNEFAFGKLEAYQSVIKGAVTNIQPPIEAAESTGTTE